MLNITWGFGLQHRSSYHHCYSRSSGSSQHIIFLSIRVINCEKRLDYAAGFSADNVLQERSSTGEIDEDRKRELVSMLD
jgi:hypothetical protein